MDLRHEVPTHLEVEDKPFFGLNMQQFVTAFVGLVSVGVLYNYILTWTPLVIRIAICLFLGLMVLAVVLIRPSGMSLSDWIWLRLDYLVQPKVAFFGVQELIKEQERESD
jgi:PrgI family protein